MSEPVTCRRCIVDGITSTVRNIGSSQTLMGYLPFYDSEGKQHRHNPNKTTTSYLCSNRHCWNVTTNIVCWCGWPEPEIGSELGQDR